MSKFFDRINPAEGREEAQAHEDAVIARRREIDLAREQASKLNLLGHFNNDGLHKPNSVKANTGTNSFTVNNTAQESPLRGILLGRRN